MLGFVWGNTLVDNVLNCSIESSCLTTSSEAPMWACTSETSLIDAHAFVHKNTLAVCVVRALMVNSDIHTYKNITTQ